MKTPALDRQIRIRDGVGTYTGRYTKRDKRPYVRDFRRHVEISDVSVPEIKEGMMAAPREPLDEPVPIEPSLPEPLDEPVPIEPSLPEPLDEPVPLDKPAVSWEPPRITNKRVERQMRGKGFKFKDGYPVFMPSGKSGKTFTTGECVYKYNQDGALFLVWEKTTWDEQLEVQYEPIIDQPLVLDEGKPAKSMFQLHHGWINNLAEYRKKKINNVRNVRPGIAAKRVAWIDDGDVVYSTTIGYLLAQSLSILEG